jgi:WD40 repeat protein
MGATMGSCSSKYSDRPSSSSSSKDATTAITIGSASLHSGPVFGLYRISEERILSCGEDKRILLHDWSSSSGEPVAVFAGHTKPVNRVAAHGDMLYSISRDLTLRSWNLQGDSSCLHAVEQAHSLNISGLAISPSGSNVATGSRDYTVKKWDSGTLTAVNEFKVPRNIVTCMRFDTEMGNMIYQGSEDLVVRIWDTRSQISQPSMVLSGYVYFPLCMDVESTTLVTGCKGFNGVGCEVKIWDLRNPSEPTYNISGHTQDVTDCYLFDGKVFSVSKDGSYSLCDSSSGTQNHLSPCSGKIHMCIAGGLQKSDVDSITIGSFDGSLQRIKIDSCECIAVTPAFYDNGSTMDECGGGLDS